MYLAVFLIFVVFMCISFILGSFFGSDREYRHQQKMKHQLIDEHYRLKSKVSELESRIENAWSELVNTSE